MFSLVKSFIYFAIVTKSDIFYTIEKIKQQMSPIITNWTLPRKFFDILRIIKLKTNLR
jgi:hypothetical protein